MTSYIHVAFFASPGAIFQSVVIIGTPPTISQEGSIPSSTVAAKASDESAYL
jgi:hypothetical protein